MRHEPVFIEKLLPAFTEEARFNRIEGTVKLNVEFNEFGEVGNIKTGKELSFGLTKKAIEAAKENKVEPFRFLNKNYPFTILMNYNFKTSK